MKTKLLSFALTMMLATGVATAQKTWNFSGNQTIWPVGTGYTTNESTSVDNLGLFGSAPGAETTITNFGTITTNNAAFPDGTTYTHRFQTNGAGYTSSAGFSAKPTQRFVHFDVSGNCTVKVWFRPGSNGSTRTMYVTNGLTTLGSGTSNNGTNTDFVTFTAPYTGPAAKLYVFGDNANNIFKIEVTGATVSAPAAIVLANDSFTVSASVKVFANQKQVSLANVTSATQVNVYSLTGALVKSFNTNADTSFDLAATGLYIVNLTSAEGQKSVKVVVE